MLHDVGMVGLAATMTKVKVATARAGEIDMPALAELSEGHRRETTSS